jgi:hypothetical protein
MPVRKIPKNYRSVTGRFPSLKNNRSVAFESTLERDFYLSLEFDEGVESYEEQPLTISGDHNGRAISYSAPFPYPPPLQPIFVLTESCACRRRFSHFSNRLK